PACHFTGNLGTIILAAECRASWQPRWLPHIFSNTPSDDIRLADDLRAVDGAQAARLEFLAAIHVAGNNPVQLGLGGTQMVPNQFAEHRTIIIHPFQIPVAGAKHRAINSACLVGRTGDPTNGIVQMTAKNTGGVASVV